jgi:Beta-lactamase enzyme family
VRRRVLALGAGALVATAVAAAPWAAAPWAAAASRSVPPPPPTPPASITLHASRTHLPHGENIVLSGLATGVATGTKVHLYAAEYPYHHPQLLRTTATRATGSYSFRVHPEENVSYAVKLAGTTASAKVRIGVVGKVFIKLKALTLGRAGVTLVLLHPKDMHWRRFRVHWWFGHGRKGRFSSHQTNRAHRLSPNVTVLSTKIALPAGHYHWRVCFQAPRDQALLNPQRPIGCKGRGYWGRGSLPYGFPSQRAIARAERELASRAGRTALAVIDTEGRLYGVHVHRTFITGSVVKAMLLVAYLRMLDARGQHYVDSYSNSFLYPMIHVSDNNAATQTWSIVGDSGLYAVAKAAGMTEFSISGIWANAMISAADQAKFFFEMDKLIPKEFVGYANNLLSHIAGYESWGIPAIARPKGYKVFFKAGWRPTNLGYLVHQIARLEGHKRTFAMAVMTDGDPDMGYGIDTIQDVTAALL